MDVVITVLMKILMDIVGKRRTDAEDCIEGVCPPSPLRNGAEILKRGLLFLQRIGIGDRSDKFDASGIKLERLLCLRSDLKDTLD